MKLNIRSFAKSSRTTQFVALSTFALALQVACSDEPAGTNPIIPGASGSGAGTQNVSGTTSTAGTFGSTAGTAGTSSGGTFGTAGTAAGGTAGSGGATGGTGGTTAGTANGGTGGTVVVVPPLDCTKVANTPPPIPLVSKWGFPDSGGTSYMEAPILGGAAATTAAGLPEGTADVWGMTWTPVTLGFVHWYWHNSAANWEGQGVCVDPAAKFVTLKAKAATDGVVAEFQAAGVKVNATLTTAWQDVTIALPVGFNAINPAGGVNTGLVVVMARASTTTDDAVRTIYWYDTKWVVEAGGGGEGGAGNGGEGGAN